MEFWSKGLGKRSSLVILCGTETAQIKDRLIVLTGQTHAPVRWTYTMTMAAEDFRDFFGLALSAPVVRILLRRPLALLRAAGWIALFFARYALALMGLLPVKPDASTPRPPPAKAAAVEDEACDEPDPA